MGCLLIDATKESNQIIRRKRDFMTQLLDGDGRCITPLQQSACKMSLFMVMHNRFLASSCNRLGYYSTIPAIDQISANPADRLEVLFEPRFVLMGKHISH